jgi:NADH-quinone oxidoreductase subunit N
VKITSILATTLTIIISREYYIQEKIKDTGHNILIVLALLGILLLVSGNDLLSIYLAIELQSLSFYTLATLKRDQESSVEAGLKYFVLGALSSGILLLGAGLIYGSTGTINLDQLTLLTFLGQDLDLFKEIGLLMGLIFIGIAFLFKIAAAPFHM